MNRRTVQFYIILLSLTLLGNSQAKKDGIMLKDYPINSILVASLTLKSPTEVSEIVILPNHSFNQIEAAEIISRIDKLPNSLLNQIKQNNIKIKLFEGKLTENPTAKHLQGIIPKGYMNNTTWDDVPGIGGSKTVLVKIGSSDKGNGHGSVNLELHELAHSIDKYIYSEIRNDKSFLDIWKKEKDLLFPNQPYFLTFPEEYFAEVFAMYYLGGESKVELKLKAPNTYKLMSNLN